MDDSEYEGFDNKVELPNDINVWSKLKLEQFTV